MTVWTLRCGGGRRGGWSGRRPAYTVPAPVLRLWQPAQPEGTAFEFGPGVTVTVTVSEAYRCGLTVTFKVGWRPRAGARPGSSAAPAS